MALVPYYDQSNSWDPHANGPPRGRMRAISVEDGRDRREGPLRGWKDSNGAFANDPYGSEGV
jgi:hypothetical protein